MITHIMNEIEVLVKFKLRKYKAKSVAKKKTDKKM